MPMNLPVSMNDIDKTHPGIPQHKASFAHATETIGSGSFPQRGRASFVTFLTR